MRIGPGEAGCYVDEGSHVKLDGKPFWYCGALTVYGMSPNYTRMDLHGRAGSRRAATLSGTSTRGSPRREADSSASSITRASGSMASSGTA